jgi:CheY-like chemotaxis protein
MSNKKTPLLVENEALVAMAQKKVFEKYEHEVIAALSGKGAIEKARTTPKIGFILMDVNFGKNKMDGIEATEAILKERGIPGSSSSVIPKRKTYREQRR